MNVYVSGNFINIETKIGDTSPSLITLPDGYSLEKIFITKNKGFFGLYSNVIITSNQERYSIVFPPINSRSPNVLNVYFNTEQSSQLVFAIEKFGQIPYSDYFKGAAAPILVTSDDGKEYNVIPSDQFK